MKQGQCTLYIANAKPALSESTWWRANQHTGSMFIRSRVVLAILLRPEEGSSFFLFFFLVHFFLTRICKGRGFLSSPLEKSGNKIKTKQETPPPQACSRSICRQRGNVHQFYIEMMMMILRNRFRNPSIRSQVYMEPSGTRCSILYQC